MGRYDGGHKQRTWPWAVGTSALCAVLLLAALAVGGDASSGLTSGAVSSTAPIGFRTYDAPADGAAEDSQLGGADKTAADSAEASGAQSTSDATAGTAAGPGSQQAGQADGSQQAETPPGSPSQATDSAPVASGAAVPDDGAATQEGSQEGQAAEGERPDSGGTDAEKGGAAGKPATTVTSGGSKKAPRKAASPGDVVGTVRYAISPYGIGVDHGSDGKALGITFGPATGSEWRGGTTGKTRVRAHEVSGTVQKEGTPALTGKDGDGHAITGTDAGTDPSGNAYRCIHYDNWATIIWWNDHDPHVYDRCVQKGCSHSVELSYTQAMVDNGIFSTSQIHGGSLVDVSGWSDDIGGSLADAVGGDGRDYIWYSAYDLGSGTLLTEAGRGYSASLVRARLVGADSLTAADDANAGTDAHQRYRSGTSVFAAFPEELRGAVAAKDLSYADSLDTSENGASYTTVTNYDAISDAGCVDRLWLPSQHEAGGTGIYPQYARQALLLIGSNDQGRGYTSWLRSPMSPNAPWGVDSNGKIGGHIGYSANAIAPGFCLRSPIEFASVSFDANGGEGSMDVIKVEKGKGAELPHHAFSRDGWAFEGWSTEPDGSGEWFDDGQRVEPEGDVTLYAQWRQVTAGGMPLFQNGLANGTLGLSKSVLDAGSHPGQKFRFHVKVIPPKGAHIADGEYGVVHGSQALVAFDANGGAGSMEPVESQVGQDVELPTCAFSRNGYTFAGWNDRADGSGASYPNGGRVPLTTSGTVTLYAQWTKPFVFVDEAHSNGGPWTTDEEMAAAFANGAEPDTSAWHVGDKRTVTLTDGHEYTMVLMDANPYEKASDETRTPHFIWGFEELLADKTEVTGFGAYYAGYTDGGWPNYKYIRNRVNGSFAYDKLPAWLKAATKRVKVVSDTGAYSSGFSVCEDSLFIPAEYEVQGEDSRWGNNAANSQLHQWEWYQTASNRVKKRNGVAGSWWERSSAIVASAFVCVVDSKGMGNYSGGWYEAGVALSGCI